MPTSLSQGSSVTVTVAQGDFIALNNASGSKARIEIASGVRKNSVVVENHVGNRSYGPFDAGSVSIGAVVGGLSYEFGKNLSGTTRVQDGGTDKSTFGADRKRRSILRPFWLAYRAAMLALNAPVANTGSVVYIDPSFGSNGAGTLADPKNAWPTLANDTTYLLKERTRIVSTATVTGATATGMVFGTYDADTGARVFDFERLATVDGASFFRCAIRWQGTSGSFTLSGLRLIGAINAAGGIQLFESITAPAASTITIEHCVFESMGSYQLVTSQINNQAIAIAGAGVTARFNRINVAGDGIGLSPAAGAGFDILCNEIITPTNLIAGGPDCVQISRTSTNAIGKWRCSGNWLYQGANAKQAFIVAGGTPQSTGEEGTFSRNFCFGVDCAMNPVLAPFTTGQIAYSNDSTSATYIVGNYFDQFLGWASVPSSGVLMHNIGIRDHASGDWLNGFGTQSGATGAIVANNTAIALNTQWSDGASNKGFEVGTSGNTVSGNICINMGMRLVTGQAETNSLFVGGRLVDTSNVLRSLGTGSTIELDAGLDEVGRPVIGSPASIGATAVTVNSMVQRYPDIFGQVSFAADSFARGAAQGWDA
jgi:hypothetical protein